MNRKLLYLLLLVAAAAIRLVLFSVGLSDVFGRRVEIITPVTSLKRGILLRAGSQNVKEMDDRMRKDNVGASLIFFQ
jgi:hypothetical protein